MSERHPYETDRDSFPAAAYRADGWGRGIAWRVYGWHLEPESDDSMEWTGEMVRSGQVVAVMVGDDCRFLFDPSDLHPLDRAEYCGECGQVGCTHDGLDRDEDEDDEDDIPPGMEDHAENDNERALARWAETGTARLDI